MAGTFREHSNLPIHKSRLCSNVSLQRARRAAIGLTGSADALNRIVDAAGRSTLGDALNAGVPPAQVAAAIFNSDEFRQDLVQAFYERLLHRPAETAGLQGWTAALRAGSRDEQVIAAIAGSAEYFVRLGPNPPGP
jgi:hypothetical protein